VIAHLLLHRHLALEASSWRRRPFFASSNNNKRLLLEASVCGSVERMPTEQAPPAKSASYLAALKPCARSTYSL
jgi:hypothetical protein